eukprot:772100-Lingulodinium_polyedra.AAC.1
MSEAAKQRRLHAAVHWQLHPRSLGFQAEVGSNLSAKKGFAREPGTGKLDAGPPALALHAWHGLVRPEELCRREEE